LKNYIENNIARFVHILRHLGIDVSILETLTSLQALRLVDIMNRDHVKMALSATLVKNHDQQVIFDQAFDSFFVAPGRGYVIAKADDNTKIAVINLSGRVFMQPLDCPFRLLDHILPLIKKVTNIIIVDFHAEATSEKMALAWYIDGRASAVVGTHTHIQTSDERILPCGTGYITDVGMTGPRDSVLGVNVESVVSKFLSLRPVRFQVAEGPIQLNAVLLEIDRHKGTTEEIERINIGKN
jgi:metallophosphoesterase (TIGR00282 family)